MAPRSSHEAATSSLASSESSNSIPQTFKTSRPQSTKNFKPEYDALSQTLLAYLVSPRGERIKIRVQFDGAAHFTMCSRRIAEELGLLGKSVTLKTEVVGKYVHTYKDQKEVYFNLESLDKNYMSPAIQACTLPDICSRLERIDINPEEYDFLRHIQFTEPLPHMCDQEVDVLLGEPWVSHFFIKKIEHPEAHLDLNIPCAMKTKLGYCLAGAKPDGVRTPKVKYTVLNTKLSITEDVGTFFDIERIGIQAPENHELTLDEQEALQKMEECSFYDPEKGFWTTSILWKGDPFPYTGRREARAVALRMEKAKTEDPKKWEELNQAFKQFEEKGFAKELPREAQYEDNCYFVQIHGVYRGSVSTPCRPVLNCAAKHNNETINSRIHAGPSYLSDLTKLLLRWRTKKYAISADVSKMYNRIRLDPFSRRFVRYYWRYGNTDEDFRVFEFQTCMYGYVCSPFQAMWVVRKHAESKAKEYKDAANSLINDIYMDDVATTTDDKETAIKIADGIRAIMESADMPMHKFLCNDKSILANIPEEMHSKETIVKILGVVWDSVKDTISIKINTDEETVEDDRITKRILLQKVARQFDPTGIFGPVNLAGKLLVKNAWDDDLDWDTPIEGPQKDACKTWIDQLQGLKNFEITRNVIPDGFEISHACIFGDASDRAMGVCAYICSKNKNQEIHSSLIFAKTKVKDNNSKWTIPRLELVAALLAARVGQFIKEALGIKKCFYFSDSDITLYRLSKDPLEHRVWEGGRLKQILALTQPTDWFYCPTKSNPADVASRSCSVDELISHDLWWSGPKMIQSDGIKWLRRSGEKTENQLAAENADAIKKEKPRFQKTDVPNTFQEEFAERYSSWRTMINVTCYVNRFINKKLKKQDKNNRLNWNYTGTIEPEEFRRAEEIHFRKTQQKMFPQEWKILKENAFKEPQFQKEISKNSNIHKLGPKFDKKLELIVVESRLSDSAHFQDLILLPYKIDDKSHHPITERYVKFIHLSNWHLPMASTTAALRQRVWVLGTRKAISAILYGCKCRGVRPIQQKIAPLPTTRTDSPVPFAHISTDYFGPMIAYEFDDNGELIKDFKCYGLLFTDFFSRAIHLELVKNLTTDTFFRAFRKLCAVRGRPSLVLSDNARTYKAANNELKQLIKKINWNKIKTKTQPFNITWKFSIELAPYSNGISERLVRSCKSAIRSMVGSAKLSYDDLELVLKEAESLVNSRPLGFQSDLLENPRAITAAELAIGRHMMALPDPPNVQGLTLAKMWALRKRLLNIFWTKWRTQYLNDLQISAKWRKGCDIPIVPGLRVLVKDRQMSRGAWKQAVIVSTKPGKDGLVRRVTLRTSTGSIIERSIRDLSYFEDSVITALRENLD